jgi:hypothetical protein
MSGARHLLPLYAFMAWIEIILTFLPFEKFRTLTLDGRTPKHQKVTGYNRLRGRFSKLEGTI